jgi:hypothetical protein
MRVEFVLSESRARILVNIRSSFFSMTINTSTVFNFDCRGRLLGAYRNGHNYLRGLDNRLLEKWGAGHGLATRSRRDLADGEKQTLLDEIRETTLSIAGAVRQGKVDPVPQQWSSGAPAAVIAALESVCGYTELAADAALFSAIYRPISILPPDRYLSLVLQVTEGCSWNKCTFCDFYRDRPFRIKKDEEFRQHIHNVVSFFGEALGLRTSVFLADANALVIPQDWLVRLLDVVNEELQVLPGRLAGEARRRWLSDHPGAFRGIYSFVDAFTVHHKDAGDYAALAQRGVRRVYIGLESGDDDVLRFLAKGSNAGDACQAVQAIKAGGIDVGVILMAGVGGRAFARRHERSSIAALNSMNLGEHDIVYFSPFMDFPGSEYSRLAAGMGVEALSAAEMDAQIAAIRSGLRYPDPGHPPKIALYDIREFIY